MKILKAIKRGAGYIPKYGHHPGWLPLIAFSLAFIAIAIPNQTFGFAFFGWFGIILLPFLAGCYERGKHEN